MKIRMIKSAASPAGTFMRGTVRDVEENLAKVWIASGAAVAVGGYETAAAPPAVEYEARGGGLTSIDGIGPATAARLQAAGIETIADLAAASAEDVADAANTTVEMAQAWQAQVS